MSHSASVRLVAWNLSREISGESRRASVRKAIPVKSAVVVNTFRCPGTSAPPKVGIEKVFLGQFPGDDFPHLWFSLTGNFALAPDAAPTGQGSPPPDGR